MSKILISFVGTGPHDGDRESRKYRTAKYNFDGKVLETEFVTKAMTEFFHPDKIFLIGTPRSMWERIYETYADNNVNDDVWYDIDDWCKLSNHDTPVKRLPHQEEVENALGEGSKVFLIRYGINEEQIIENINVVLGIRDHLKNGDEIIIDITHSFRSLPLLIMQLILYLKQVENPKVSISHVYYGMLDVKSEFNDEAPIVDISSIINLNNWITGAYAFKLNGSAKEICRLLSESEGRSAAGLIEKFSNVLNLNDMAQLQSQVQELSGIKYPTEISRLALEPTLRKFINTFNVKKASLFQYRLAEWHKNNGNYFAAYNDLVECIVTKVCEETKGYDWQNFVNREAVRKAYKAKDSVWPSGSPLYQTSVLLDVYRDINPIRNYLVHLTKTQPGKTDDILKVQKLEDAIKKLKPEINRSRNKF